MLRVYVNEFLRKLERWVGEQSTFNGPPPTVASRYTVICMHTMKHMQVFSILYEKDLYYVKCTTMEHNSKSYSNAAFASHHVFGGSLLHKSTNTITIHWPQFVFSLHTHTHTHIESVCVYECAHLHACTHTHTHISTRTETSPDMAAWCWSSGQVVGLDRGPLLNGWLCSNWIEDLTCMTITEEEEERDIHTH